MILITGAAGKTGQAIIRALVKRSTPVRALAHKDTQLKLIQRLGVEEVLSGDMSQQGAMDRALRGVKSVYHICPNVNPEEINIGKTVIRGAQSAGVNHFVYHSVLHPQVESMPHHWKKMRVEEELFKSGLSYTIIQPAPYMQNILAYWKDIVTTGKYTVPYAGDTRLNAVDLEDVAEVAATVLTEAGHEGAVYELCGLENLSQIELTDIISRYLGRQIDAEAIPVKAWEADAISKGLSEYQVDTLIKMFKYYEQFGLFGNSRLLECLLHRSPTSYANFIERTVREGL